jgi:hypothetical protein
MSERALSPAAEAFLNHWDAAWPNDNDAEQMRREFTTLLKEERERGQEKWILPADEMPRPGREVIVWLDRGYCSFGQWTGSSWISDDVGEVVAWRPLPKAPDLG